MERCKLLIADSSREFAQALAQRLQCVYALRLCHDGTRALEELRDFRPDAVVLDLMLPEIDGITLLEAAEKDGIQPAVLAISPFFSDYMLNALHSLGIGYVMRRPCQIAAVTARIGDMMHHRSASRPAAPDPGTGIANLLLSLGIPAKLRGYGYLRKAIVLMARDPGQSITKSLYPAVARCCGATPVHVERAIRGAISAGWERRDAALWRLYFGDCAQRPSNGEFICRLMPHVGEDPPQTQESEE